MPVTFKRKCDYSNPAMSNGEGDHLVDFSKSEVSSVERDHVVRCYFMGDSLDDRQLLIWESLV